MGEQALSQNIVRLYDYAEIDSFPDIRNEQSFSKNGVILLVNRYHVKLSNTISFQNGYYALSIITILKVSIMLHYTVLVFIEFRLFQKQKFQQ